MVATNAPLDHNSKVVRGLERSEMLQRQCCVRGERHLVEHAMQLVPRLADSLAIITVHDEDEALRVLEIVPPERTNLQAKAVSFWTPVGDQHHMAVLNSV